MGIVGRNGSIVGVIGRLKMWFFGTSISSSFILAIPWNVGPALKVPCRRNQLSPAKPIVAFIWPCTLPPGPSPSEIVRSSPRIASLVAWAYRSSKSNSRCFIFVWSQVPCPCGSVLFNARCFRLTPEVQKLPIVSSSQCRKLVQTSSAGCSFRILWAFVPLI